MGAYSDVGRRYNSIFEHKSELNPFKETLVMLESVPFQLCKLFGTSSNQMSTLGGKEKRYNKTV